MLFIGHMDRRIITNNVAAMNDAMRQRLEIERLRGRTYVDPRFVLPRRGI